jgi:hypothetical protein
MEMSIMLGITEKGMKDVCIVAKDTEEGIMLTDLFNKIEPEINAFEDVINEKLNTENQKQGVR